ncbi:MAG: hypothetical protein M1822_003319 [Bathelium mastoideum]|nr:MAG: hypothetical protein M1822_003319 [Bathelium mastoideum]
MKLAFGTNALLITAILCLQRLSAGNPVPEPRDALNVFPRGGGSGGRTDPEPGKGKPGSNVVPNLGQGFGIGTVAPLQTYQNQGQQRLSAYQEAVSQNEPDTKIVQTPEDVDTKTKKSFLNFMMNKQYFGIQEDYPRGANFPELQAFDSKDLGVNPESIRQLKEITIVDKTSKDLVKPIINRGSYDPNGVVMLAEAAFKAHDKTPRNSPERIPVNELSWQAFASVAKQGKKSLTTNLKVIFLINIQNKGFWSIAAQNYKEIGLEPNKMHVWERGDAAATRRFERFIGSDNANGKVLFLTNHHTAAGNKKILKVITVPKGAPGSSNKFTAAIVLE